MYKKKKTEILYYIENAPNGIPFLNIFEYLLIYQRKLCVYLSLRCFSNPITKVSKVLSVI